MYTRQSPSPNYLSRLELYRQMHEVGDLSLGVTADKTFTGSGINEHIDHIKTLTGKHQAKTLLDYGSGKGHPYAQMKVQGVPVLNYWGVSSVRCYDPGYKPYAERPDGQFDGVICTNVLEHCHLDDLEWIIDELFQHARSFLFVTVACYGAQKRLPNGDNPHCTVQPKNWWVARLDAHARRYPHIDTNLKTLRLNQAA